MPGKIRAVLEIKLILSALLSWACGSVAVRRCVTQDGGTELLVHEDPGLLFWHAGRDGRLETVVDHLLSRSDLRGLCGVQVTVPAEHFRLERAAMVERQNVEWSFEADGSHAEPFIFR